MISFTLFLLFALLNNGISVNASPVAVPSTSSPTSVPTSRKPTSIPTTRSPAATGFEIDDIKSGYLHSCILTSTKKIKCWGLNLSGQLGLGDTNSRGDSLSEMGDNLPFVDVGTDLRVTQISLGATTTCALLTPSYKAKCWGHNSYGQLGQGDVIIRGDNVNEMGDNLPLIDFGTNLPLTQISTGGFFTCTLISDGTVKCFGYNYYGQLGIGSTVTIGDEPYEMGINLTQTDLGTGFVAKSIHTSSTGYHVCAISYGGKVKCWGNNRDGQLGLGDTENRGDNLYEMGDNLTEIDIGTGKKATQLSTSPTFTCVLLDDLTTRCWGVELVGSFGTGTSTVKVEDSPKSMGDNLVATNFGTGLHATIISCGFGNLCGVLDNNQLKCYGANFNGQLGQGDTASRGDSPTTVGDNLPAVDLGTNIPITHLSLGDEFVCVVFNSAKLKCFGQSNFGALGLGITDSTNPFVTTDVGDGPEEMGTNLPYVNLGQTQAPTSSPTRSPTPPTLPTFNPSNAPSKSPVSSIPTITPTKKANTKSPTTKLTKSSGIVKANAKFALLALSILILFLQ